MRSRGRRGSGKGLANAALNHTFYSRVNGNTASGSITIPKFVFLGHATINGVVPKNGSTFF